MELKSRLGEYGSVGAGGADCAEEVPTMIMMNQNRALMGFFIDVSFDLVYPERSEGTLS